jgi:hypothetical protein
MLMLPVAILLGSIGCDVRTANRTAQTAIKVAELKGQKAGIEKASKQCAVRSSTRIEAVRPGTALPVEAECWGQIPTGFARKPPYDSASLPCNPVSQNRSRFLLRR